MSETINERDFGLTTAAESHHYETLGIRILQTITDIREKIGGRFIPTLTALTLAVSPGGASAHELPVAADRTIDMHSQQTISGMDEHLRVSGNSIAVIKFDLKSDNTLPDCVTGDQIDKAIAWVYVEEAAPGAVLSVSPHYGYFPKDTESLAYMSPPILQQESYLPAHIAENTVSWRGALPIGNQLQQNLVEPGKYSTFDVTDPVKAWFNNPDLQIGLAFESESEIVMGSNQGRKSPRLHISPTECPPEATPISD